MNISYGHTACVLERQAFFVVGVSMLLTSVRDLSRAAVFALATLTAGLSQSAPVSVGLGAFGPGSTTFSFGSSGAPGFAGINFSGFVQIDPSLWGSASAPAYNSAYAHAGSISFSTPTDLVGFYFGGNTANKVELDIDVAGLLAGSFLLETTGANFNMGADGVTNWKFYGFQDVGGITALHFKTEQNGAWAYGIGELKIGSAEATVPEPGSLALVVLAVIAGSTTLRRRS